MLSKDSIEENNIKAKKFTTEMIQEKKEKIIIKMN